MGGPKVRILFDILEEHIEELGFLWEQRKDALGSSECTSSDVAELEERIQAHLQGILVGGEDAVLLLHERLAGDDPEIVFAAVFALLRIDTEDSARLVIEAFLQAEEDRLQAIGEALSHGPIDKVRPHLREASSSAPAPVAAAALRALVFHRDDDIDLDRLPEFTRDEDPVVRRIGWQIAGMLDFGRTRNLFTHQ